MQEEQLWYVTVDGETTVGPVTLDQLKRGVAAGKIPPTGKVALVGTSEWVDVASVVSLQMNGDDVEIASAPGIAVYGSRVVVGGATYPIAGVTSVRLQVLPKPPTLIVVSAIALIVACALAAASATVAWRWMPGGEALAALGTGLALAAAFAVAGTHQADETKYAAVLAVGAETARSLPSTDRSAVENAVSAVVSITTGATPSPKPGPLRATPTRRRHIWTVAALLCMLCSTTATAAWQLGGVAPWAQRLARLRDWNKDHVRAVSHKDGEPGWLPDKSDYTPHIFHYGDQISWQFEVSQEVHPANGSPQFRTDVWALTLDEVRLVRPEQFGELRELTVALSPNGDRATWWQIIRSPLVDPGEVALLLRAERQGKTVYVVYGVGYVCSSYRPPAIRPPPDVVCRSVRAPTAPPAASSGAGSDGDPDAELKRLMKRPGDPPGADRPLKQPRGGAE